MPLLTALPAAAPLKRFAKSAFAAKAASRLVAFYIRLVQATSKITVVGVDNVRALENADQRGFIIAFWHARLLMAPAVRKEVSRPFRMLISTHRDGEIIASAVKGFDIGFVRGSTANAKKTFKNKSGARAVGQMIDAIENGEVVGVTPDGPRGPAEKAQIGIIRLAAMTGAPIIPVACAASRAKRLNTWDRFLLVLPFSKIAAVAGPPIAIGELNDPEAVATARHTLEVALAKVVQEAEDLVAPRERRGGASSQGAPSQGVSSGRLQKTAAANPEPQR
ncbi:MAG: lysophospholipid acyltransferase family protein [Pseudomonadota bacterium]